MKDELFARISRSTPSIALDPGAAGEALAWSLLFELWPEMLPGSPVDRETAFYNQYFWLKRYATLKQAQEGYDAGLEQQVFELLEQPGFDLDWSLMEELAAEAADARG